MTRYLLLSSILLLFACTSVKVDPQKNLPCANSPTFQWDSTQVYKTSISVFQKNLSGLIILNKENDSTYRLIMTTDMGPKLIDLTLTNKDYTKNFVVTQLDRKALLKMFWEDFGSLLGLFTFNKTGTYSNNQSCVYPISKKITVHYFTNNYQSFPSTAYLLNGNEKKTKINYFCEVGQQPDSITIEHLEFNMRYFLNKLN